MNKEKTLLIRYCVFLLVFILTFGSCFDQNEFEYNGEYPEWKYIKVPNAGRMSESMENDTIKAAFRNRIYVTIDSSLNLFLNGHAVSVEEFERDFKFIYINPNKLNHLPESTDKVVIYYAINYSITNLREYLKSPLRLKKNQIEAGEMQLKIQRVILDLKEKYVASEYGIRIDEIDSTQQVNIEQKYPLTYFMYSPIYEKVIGDKGIISKLPPASKKEVDLVERNIIRVVVGKRNKVLLRGKPIKVNTIKSQIKTMIKNDTENISYPENPKRAIVSLTNDKDAKYSVYLKVYNNILKAYQELWEEKSQEYFGRPFTELNKEENRKIKQEIPMMFSESEPTSIDK